MMNNNGIAIELKRVAKGLVSSKGVANTAGEYENFTGVIDWKGSNGRVKNATFELTNRGIIWYNGIWRGGTWKDGTWKGGDWKDGRWEDGIWEYGTWRDGTWCKGTWESGFWYDGTWEYGEWNCGNWWGGTWESGADKYGVEHPDNPNNW